MRLHIDVEDGGIKESYSVKIDEIIHLMAVGTLFDHDWCPDTSFSYRIEGDGRVNMTELVKWIQDYFETNFSQKIVDVRQANRLIASAACKHFKLNSHGRVPAWLNYVVTGIITEP